MSSTPLSVYPSRSGLYDQNKSSKKLQICWKYVYSLARINSTPFSVRKLSSDVNKDKTWKDKDFTYSYLLLNLQSLSSNNNERKVKVHNI